MADTDVAMEDDDARVMEEAGSCGLLDKMDDPDSLMWEVRLNYEDANLMNTMVISLEQSVEH